ncbi:MAG: triphosphoribosyl-dephospho-CoA synthase, partial [Gemmatimonadetes bacterium]|nr:triphosphoribosyl-dephospho-CoA synthase [Gemmatimonadota bacterium]
MWPESAIARAAELACRIEATALKPGNVTPLHSFPRMTYDDFLRSAAAIGPVLGAAGQARVGEVILRAVRATRAVAAANTNLGMVLLLAPLAKGAAAASTGSVEGLRRAVRTVLADLDMQDARLAYEAIRLARPGGMGAYVEQDLSTLPSVTLLEAMTLAKGRDGVAREYASGYATTFEDALPLLDGALAQGHESVDAAVEVYLGLLARTPDTLVERKHGERVAREVSARAAAVLACGAAGSVARGASVSAFDAWLRRAERPLNPG